MHNLLNLHNDAEIWRGAILAIILTIAVITDIRTQKIYNWLTFPGMAVGIVLNSLIAGWYGVLLALGGIAVSLVWLILVMLRGSGFGDLKLLMTVGAFMGWTFTAWTLLYTAVAGGVLGVVYTLFRGGWSTLKFTGWNMFVGSHEFRADPKAESLKGMVDNSKAGKMAYAPAIAAGVLIEWLLRNHNLIQ